MLLFYLFYIFNIHRNKNTIKCIFYLIFRIYPMYITVIVIFAFILPYMGDGPLWKLIVYPEAEFCRKNWWTNLLFINNYVYSNEMVIILFFIYKVIFYLILIIYLNFYISFSSYYTNLFCLNKTIMNPLH